MAVFSQPLIEAPEGAICRVCHCTAFEDEEENGSNPLLSPCLCDGSVRWVHRKCLNYWRLQGSSRKFRATRCELCGVTYLYELRWIPRRQKICKLLFRNLIVVGTVGAFSAIFAETTSPLDSVYVTGCGAFILAIADMLSWALGKCSAWNAVKQLDALARATGTRGDMLANAQAVAQIHALEQAQRVANALTRLRERTSPIDAEVEMEQEVVPQDAPEEDSFAVAGHAATVAAADLETQWQSSYPQDDFHVEFIEAPERRLRRRAWLNSDRAFRCAKDAGLLFSLVLLGISYMMSEVGSPVRFGILIAMASLGAIYWIVAMLLDLAVELCSPPRCEPSLGKDGLCIARSLTASEREALSKPMEQSAGSS